MARGSVGIQHHCRGAARGREWPVGSCSSGQGEEALSPFGLSLRAAQLGHLMESKTRCQGRMEERKVGSTRHDSGTLENVSPSEA